MPVVNTTNTFTNNEQITSTKLNDIMGNSSFVSGAVVTSGGLEITAGGQMQIKSDGVTTARILNSNVTTAKIADEAVITEKISDSAITTIKLENSTSSTTGVTTAKIADSNVTTAKLANASVTAAKLDGNQSGFAPIFGIRAFVNFEGRNTNGSCTIRSSGNVTSVTRTATGKYRINFQYPMPSPPTYAVVCNAGSTNAPRLACADRATATVSSVEVETNDPTGPAADYSENSVMVIR
jgi:hypothetical protein